MPVHPFQDMHKLMNKDKIILRFSARMAETATHKLSKADASRSFVLSYFMMDDSVLIFEPPIRNSGITGGKFLERQRVYKPESEEIYTYQVSAGGTDACVGICIVSAMHGGPMHVSSANG